ncbi:MAG: hypothetical protein LC104_13915, partial [Bacteroidales bacterium]|nr:hypothetical protein [Bacteroidales bacterium]
DTIRNGVYVASGDINGDGYDEILIGGGPDGGPRVIGLDGWALWDTQGQGQTLIVNFFAGDPRDRNGVRVAVKDLDNDNFDDLIVAAADEVGPGVFGYFGKTLHASGVPLGAAFDPHSEPMLRDGIYVG